jgi:hypothetical protein
VQNFRMDGLARQVVDFGQAHETWAPANHIGLLHLSSGGGHGEAYHGGVCYLEAGVASMLSGIGVGVDTPLMEEDWTEWWLRSRRRFRRKERRAFDSLAILICWRLWKQRNARAFANVRGQFSAVGLVEQVLAEWDLWTKAGLGGCNAFARVVH